MAKTTPLSRDEFMAFRTLQTRWADNDIYGHMNNVVHYALFDTAVNGWLIDLELLDPQNGETIGLVVETKCNYFSELKFPDTIVAGIRVAYLGTSSVKYEIALFANEDETASAQGHFVHVYVGKESRTPQPLAKLWRLALEDFLR